MNEITRNLVSAEEVSGEQGDDCGLNSSGTWLMFMRRVTQISDENNPSNVAYRCAVMMEIKSFVRVV